MQTEDEAREVRALLIQGLAFGAVKALTLHFNRWGEVLQARTSGCYPEGCWFESSRPSHTLHYVLVSSNG